MQEILLTTGLACIIAGIIGGGLNAFGIKIPVIRTWTRQIVLVLFGSLLAFASVNIKPENKPGRVTTGPTPVREVRVSFARIGGPFVELGPSKQHPVGASYWHNMDINIVNECSESVHVDPSRFRLYISDRQTTDGAKVFSPAVGVTYSGRLAAGWLEAGNTATGRLVFQVPKRLSSGADPNAMFHIIRGRLSSICTTVYRRK